MSRISAQSAQSARQLKADLIAIAGDAAVLSDPRELLVYECDAFTLEKNLPQIAVLPANAAEVEVVVQTCKKHNAPLIPRGAGTSLSGSTLAVDGGVIIGLSRMNRILNLDQPIRLHHRRQCRHQLRRPAHPQTRRHRQPRPQIGIDHRRRRTSLA